MSAYFFGVFASSLVRVASHADGGAWLPCCFPSGRPGSLSVLSVSARALMDVGSPLTRLSLPSYRVLHDSGSRRLAHDTTCCTDYGTIAVALPALPDCLCLAFYAGWYFRLFGATHQGSVSHLLSGFLLAISGNMKGIARISYLHCWRSAPWCYLRVPKRSYEAYSSTLSLGSIRAQWLVILIICCS